jgi:Kef-type K+ transport system membrane component KefB
MMSSPERGSPESVAGFEAYFQDKPEGAISAAIIAGGIGVLALGILTTLAEASDTVKGWLEFNAGVGALSGVTILAVAIWLISWAVLHTAMHRTEYESRRAFAIAIVLIVLGVIGTFPTFFELFAPE